MLPCMDIFLFPDLHAKQGPSTNRVRRWRCSCPKAADRHSKHTTTCSASTAATVERHIICPPAADASSSSSSTKGISLSLLFVSVSVLPTRHLHHHHRSFLPLLLLHHLTDPLLSFHSTSCPLSFTLPRSLPAQQPVNSPTPTATTTTTTTTIKSRLPAIAVPPPTIPLHLSPAHDSPPPWASSSTSARDRSCARPPRPSQPAKSHTCLSAEDAISPSA